MRSKTDAVVVVSADHHDRQIEGFVLEFISIQVYLAWAIGKIIQTPTLVDIQIAIEQNNAAFVPNALQRM